MFVFTAKQTLTRLNIESIKEASDLVKKDLVELVFTTLHKQKATLEQSLYDMVALDLSVCALGLVDNFTKKDLEFTDNLER